MEVLVFLWFSFLLKLKLPKSCMVFVFQWGTRGAHDFRRGWVNRAAYVRTVNKFCHLPCQQGHVFQGSKLFIGAPLIFASASRNHPGSTPLPLDFSSWPLPSWWNSPFPTLLFSVCCLFCSVTHFPWLCNSSHTRPLLSLQSALHLSRSAILCKPPEGQAAVKSVTGREQGTVRLKSPGSTEI